MAAVRIATLMICLLSFPATLAAQSPDPADSVATGSAEKIKELEQRIQDLEQTRAAQEEATRSIIRQTIEKSGSKINNVASFGGVFEMQAGRTRDFAGSKEHVMQVNGMEFQFDVQVGEWTSGSFITQYADGQDVLFVTAERETSGVARFDLDTAWLTLGDTRRFPLYTTFGRMILPFGVSTGDPVADVPTIDDPLTIEGFEFREDAVLVGIGLPTPPPAPTVSVLAPPPVKPKALRPLFGGLAHLLGYRPPPVVPTEPAVVEPVSPPPPLNLGVLWYHGATVNHHRPATAWYPGLHWGATAGYRTTGPTAFDVTLDYNSSVFDSRFLQAGYGGFLDEIGLIPGMAASLKAKTGPVGFVAEWNGAIKNAQFMDDANRRQSIAPRAWQLGMIYQLGWNSGVEALGAQGTYVAVDYSRSVDLAGIIEIPVNQVIRRGDLPLERLLVSVGEWVMDGVRVQFEYAYIKDYPTTEFGTGQSGSSVFGKITYDW